MRHGKQRRTSASSFNIGHISYRWLYGAGASLSGNRCDLDCALRHLVVDSDSTQTQSFTRPVQHYSFCIVKMGFHHSPRSFFHSSPEKVKYVEDKAGKAGRLPYNTLNKHCRIVFEHSELPRFICADLQVALPLPKRLQLGRFHLFKGCRPLEGAGEQKR